MKKRGFVSFIIHKEWRLVDFLEPLAALPFAFGLVFVIQRGLDVYGLLLLIGLFFVYLPAVIVLFERVVR